MLVTYLWVHHTDWSSPRRDNNGLVSDVLRLPDVVLGGHVKDNGENEECHEGTQLHVDAHERTEEERQGRSETLKHAKVLEGNVVLGGTAEADET